MTVDDAIATSRATRRARAVDEITDLFVAAGCHRARFRVAARRSTACSARSRGRSRAADGALDGVDADALRRGDDDDRASELRACEAIERALRDDGRAGRAAGRTRFGGLDADALLPTSRWLIRRVLETRERRSGETRAYARRAYARERGARGAGDGADANEGDAREAGAAGRVRRAASVQTGGGTGTAARERVAVGEIGDDGVWA